jgi:hypothetical protein
MDCHYRYNHFSTKKAVRDINLDSFSSYIYENLDFLGNKITFEAASTQFKRDSSSLNKRLNLYKIGLPSAASMVFCVTHIISSNSVFSAKITSP